MPKKETVLKTIKNLYFYYTQVNTPVITKAAKDKGIKVDPENPKKNCEYTLKVAMPYETFRKLKKQDWAEGASNFPKAKEFTLAKFEAAFHSEGGMPDFGDDVEEVVLIKFSQKSMSNAGKEMNSPKLIGIKGKVQDNNGETIAQDTLIGNGSKGHLQVRPVQFSDYDPYLYPHAICITDLVVYEGGEGAGIDEDGFGIEELDEADLDAEADDMESDDFDDDIPF